MQSTGNAYKTNQEEDSPLVSSKLPKLDNNIVELHRSLVAIRSVYGPCSGPLRR